MFSSTLPTVLRSYIGLLFVMSEGSFFLCIGVTLACFHKAGTFPLIKEALKISNRGKDKGLASSFRILLLIASGPEALPV